MEQYRVSLPAINKLSEEQQTEVDKKVHERNKKRYPKSQFLEQIQKEDMLKKKEEYMKNYDRKLRKERERNYGRKVRGHVPQNDNGVFVTKIT